MVNWSMILAKRIYFRACNICVGWTLCLCMFCIFCLRVCTDVHLEILWSMSFPAHLFIACFSCISACLVLVPYPPAGSHLKTCIFVSLAHLCWICSGWLSSVSKLTYEPHTRGWTFQNAWFECSLHWAPHHFSLKRVERGRLGFRNSILSGCSSQSFPGTYCHVNPGVCFSLFSQNFIVPLQ